jgi:hypothetical protein
MRGLVAKSTFVFLNIGIKTIEQIVDQVDVEISMCTAAPDVLTRENMVTFALSVSLYSSHSMYKVAQYVKK